MPYYPIIIAFKLTNDERKLMMLRGLAFNPKILHFSPSLPLFSLNSPSFSSRLPSFSGLSHSPSVYFFCMYWPFGWFCGKFRKRRENRKFCVCCYPFLKRKTSYFLCQFVGLWSVEWRVLFQLITKENSSIQSFKFGFFFFFSCPFHSNKPLADLLDRWKKTEFGMPRLLLLSFLENGKPSTPTSTSWK